MCLIVSAQSSVGYWLGWKGAGSQMHVQRRSQRGDVHVNMRQM